MHSTNTAQNKTLHRNNMVVSDPKELKVGTSLSASRHAGSTAGSSLGLLTVVSLAQFTHLNKNPSSCKKGGDDEGGEGEGDGEGEGEGKDKRAPLNCLANEPQRPHMTACPCRVGGCIFSNSGPYTSSDWKREGVAMGMARREGKKKEGRAEERFQTMGRHRFRSTPHI